MTNILDSYKKIFYINNPKCKGCPGITGKDQKQPLADVFQNRCS